MYIFAFSARIYCRIKSGINQILINFKFKYLNNGINQILINLNIKIINDCCWGKRGIIVRKWGVRGKLQRIIL